MPTLNDGPLKPAPPAGIPAAVPVGAAAPPSKPLSVMAAEAVARAEAAAQQRAVQDALIEEGEDTDPRPSKVRLESFAAKIKERLEDVTEIFKGTSYDPLKNKEFTKFLDDQVAEMAMRYVRVGTVAAHDADAISPDERARIMKKKGFTVGSAAQGDANAKQAAEGDTGTTTDTSAATGDMHDANFLDSPAVQAAKAMGFDPHSDD